MKMALFWAACAVLGVVPLYFIWNQVYKDGVIGRAALLLISGAALGTTIDALLSDQVNKYDPPPSGVAMTVAFAAFLVWHLWRFHRRVDRQGQCPPDCPQDRRKLPDRRYVGMER